MRIALLGLATLALVSQAPTGTNVPDVEKYRLRPDTTLKGTDGKPVGADIDAILAATCGVIEGIECAAVGALRPAGKPVLR